MHLYREYIEAQAYKMWLYEHVDPWGLGAHAREPTLPVDVMSIPKTSLACSVGSDTGFCGNTLYTYIRSLKPLSATTEAVMPLLIACTTNLTAGHKSPR